MTTRKNFNYHTATVQEIAEKFKASSRQSVWDTRKRYKDNAEMTAKLNEAWILYKISLIEDARASMGYQQHHVDKKVNEILNSVQD